MSTQTSATLPLFPLYKELLVKPLAVFALFISALASAQDIPTIVNSELPQLVATYKQLHEHPELSEQEKQTSALVADALRKAGYTVTENVGKYADGRQAYGIVAVMKNGNGPTVLVRCGTGCSAGRGKDRSSFRQPRPLEEPGG